MNCARARFLIYAYLDREVSSPESESLARHLAICGSCDARAASARGLARLLHSGIERRPAPDRLLARLHGGFSEPALRHRIPLFASAAALLILLLPLVSDGPSPGGPLATAAMVPLAAQSARPKPAPVSRRMTGTFVCLECEARAEAGLCPVSHAEHQTGFCAENGELWLVMSGRRDAESAQSSIGRTATVEGVAFPESGFMRVSRVGY